MMNNDFPGDSIRRFLAAQDEREKLLRLVDPYASVRSQFGQSTLAEFERTARMTREVDSGWRRHLADSVKDGLDEHMRAMRDAAGPLMRLRAETLFEAQLARAATLSPKNYATGVSDSITQQHAKMLSDVAGATKLTESVSDYVRRAMEKQTLSRTIDLAKPFGSIGEHIQRQLTSVAGIFDGGEWARKLGIPTIDAASIVTVARLWGAEGALRNLRELGGVDRETLRLLAATLETELEEEAGSDGETGTEHLGARTRRQGGAISFGEIVAILSILLTLLIWDAQNRDSEEMEGRLRADNRALAAHVKQAEDRTAQRIEQWSRLAEVLIAQAQAPHAVQFVVRSRGAEIKLREGGRAVVAEAFPGQVVTMIAEEGKWIEISYLDFATGERRAGWALKKYFVRAKTAVPRGEAEE